VVTSNEKKRRVDGEGDWGNLERPAEKAPRVVQIRGRETHAQSIAERLKTSFKRVGGDYCGPRKAR